jgi:hypothetical protein
MGKKDKKLAKKEYYENLDKLSVAARLRKQEEERKKMEAVAFLRQKKQRGNDFWGMVEKVSMGQADKGALFDLLKNAFTCTNYDALKQLLRICEGKKVLDIGRFAMSYYGKNFGNSYFNGLRNIANYSSQWIRRPEDFVCNIHNPHRYFAALVRHLLARYDVPAFMDGAWFSDMVHVAQPVHLMDCSWQKNKEQDWFVHIGRGNNIRTASGLPFELTKKTAHFFLQAPNNYTINQAFRFGQIIALGGSQRLCDTIIGTRIGNRFENEDFWGTVVAWLVQNAMLDSVYVGPIIDYIYNQRYVLIPDEIRNGEIVRRGLGPPQPGFNMKGRTPDTLLTQVNRWHRDLAKTKIDQDFEEWASCGIPGIVFEEGDKPYNKRVFVISEITSSKTLFAEGRIMHHCVGSYTTSCKHGRVAIYSLKCNSESRATIEIDPRAKRVVQARGKYNAIMDPVDTRVMRAWAAKNGISISAWL